MSPSPRRRLQASSQPRTSTRPTQHQERTHAAIAMAATSSAGTPAASAAAAAALPAAAASAGPGRDAPDGVEASVRIGAPRRCVRKQIGALVTAASAAATVRCGGCGGSCVRGARQASRCRRQLESLACALGAAVVVARTAAAGGAPGETDLGRADGGLAHGAPSESRRRRVCVAHRHAAPRDRPVPRGWESGLVAAPAVHPVPA